MNPELQLIPRGGKTWAASTNPDPVNSDYLWLCRGLINSGCQVRKIPPPCSACLFLPYRESIIYFYLICWKAGRNVKRDSYRRELNISGARGSLNYYASNASRMAPHWPLATFRYMKEWPLHVDYISFPLTTMCWRPRVPSSLYYRCRMDPICMWVHAH